MGSWCQSDTCIHHSLHGGQSTSPTAQEGRKVALLMRHCVSARDPENHLHSTRAGTMKLLNQIGDIGIIAWRPRTPAIPTSQTLIQLFLKSAAAPLSKCLGGTFGTYLRRRRPGDECLHQIDIDPLIHDYDRSPKRKDKPGGDVLPSLLLLQAHRYSFSTSEAPVSSASIAKGTPGWGIRSNDHARTIPQAGVPFREPGLSF